MRHGDHRTRKMRSTAVMVWRDDTVVYSLQASRHVRSTLARGMTPRIEQASVVTYRATALSVIMSPLFGVPSGCSASTYALCSFCCQLRISDNVGTAFSSALLRFYAIFCSPIYFQKDSAVRFGKNFLQGPSFARILDVVMSRRWDGAEPLSIQAIVKPTASVTMGSDCGEELRRTGEAIVATRTPGRF